MNPDNINIPIAILGGLLSFASPCVLPLVPAYLGYLSGRSIGEGDGQQKLHMFWHSLAFVLGFTVVFVALGASIGILSSVFFTWRPWITKIGGIVIIVFGLHTIGLLKIPLLYQERRVEMRRRPALGYLSSFLMGIFFSAGWMPCVGTILAAIMTLATNVDTAGQGAALLGAYSLGLGIPFLAAGLAFNALGGFLRRVNRHLHVVSVVSGVFLILVGVLVFTNSMQYFARFGSFLGA